MLDKPPRDMHEGFRWPICVLWKAKYSIYKPLTNILKIEKPRAAPFGRSDVIWLLFRSCCSALGLGGEFSTLRQSLEERLYISATSNLYVRT